MTMSPSDDARRRLAGLARSTPEWEVYLGLLGAAIEETNDTAWGNGGPATLDPARVADAPALAGAVLTVDPALVRRWGQQLFERGATGRGPSAAALRAAMPRIDHLAFLEAAVDMDLTRVDALAAGAGVEPGPLRGLMGLVSMPLLQACGRQLRGGIPDTWSAGSCPVCGAWPALAEERGIERQKRLRCVRCGGDWGTEWQRCPFCGVTDHRHLGALVSESKGETRKAETCEGCHGYIKAVATLQPLPAETVAIEDVATVDLDVAALERGYSRPERPRYALGTRVVGAPAGEQAVTVPVDLRSRRRS